MSDTKKPRVNPKGTPFATPDITAERVNDIALRMREGLWLRGKSAGEFADIWGISQVRVEQLAAEAWRRVCSEADDPEKMRPEIAGILRQNLSRADKLMNFRAI